MQLQLERRPTRELPTAEESEAKCILGSQLRLGAEGAEVDVEIWNRIDQARSGVSAPGRVARSRDGARQRHQRQGQDRCDDDDACGLTDRHERKKLAGGSFV